MVERLKEKCDKEFDSILATRDVVRKMNDLEGLIADAEERRASGKSEDVPTPYVRSSYDGITEEEANNPDRTYYHQTKY